MSETILEKIASGGFDSKQLDNLYSNAERLGRKEIMAAAKSALKALDARFYSKRFVKPIREKVERIAKSIAGSEGWAAWPDNVVANGIKPGGAMLNGKELAEFYLAYRNPKWTRPANLTVFQHDEQSTVLFKITAPTGEEAVFENSSDAIDRFRAAVAV